MTNHPRRTEIAAARRAAKEAGFYIREGEYHGTPDNRIGRWYIGHNAATYIRPFGAGYATQGDAWLAAANAITPDS